MIVYKNQRYALGFVIVLICVLSCVCGGDESVSIGESSYDGVEEVSIEAVEDDDDTVSLSVLARLQRSIGIEDSGASTAPDRTLAREESDNSTAVATVYPGDISGSLTNGTKNSTNSTTASRYLRMKVSCCQLYPEGSNSSNVGTVEIVNMTYLLHGLLVNNPTIKTRSTPSNCTIVLFYTHWCPWSAKAAPHFNALPRAYHNIRFAAIDSSVHTAINTYFGILSVPSVVLFYNGKILAKFNDTTFNVNQFGDFISTFTDQKPAIRLNVTSADFVGPLQSACTKGPDWYLFMSWAFIIACFIYYVSRTAIWHRVLELMQNSWREAEAVASVPPQHFHQD